MLAAARGRLRGGPLARVLALLAAVQAVALLAAAPAGADAVRNTEQWVLDALHVQQAWATTKGAGVVVAVIDSGVNPHVSDLAGAVRTGRDLTGVHTPSASRFWGVHGTWMASLIAGHGHAGGESGIVGVAPEATVLSIRVITDQGDPNFAAYQREPPGLGQRELAMAIRDAVSRHASVISMSLGYSRESVIVRQALQYAFDHNVVVVASAGNSGSTARAGGLRRIRQAPYSFPADYPGVLAVAAVDRAGQPASFSSQNLSVQVAAPGFQVAAQGRDGAYWLVSGTSPACALTAGVAALIKAKYPRLSDGAVISAITSTTTPASRPRGGYNDEVGFGEVNAAAAIAAAGRLAARATGTASAVAPAAHFGGGVAGIPAPPVPPRSLVTLVLFCLLGAVSLTLVAAAIFRLFGLRDSVPGQTSMPEPATASPLARIAASSVGRHAAPRGRGDGNGIERRSAERTGAVLNGADRNSGIDFNGEHSDKGHDGEQR